MSILLDNTHNPCIKLLEVVGELHKQGYELIRIFPYFSPSGCYWRCVVSTKDCSDTKYGLKPNNSSEKKEALFYSSGSMYKYFDLLDYEKKSLKQIAKRLLMKYPLLKKKGKGQDTKYKIWYEKLLTLAKQGNIPSCMDDYFNCFDKGFILCGEVHLELPSY